MKKSNLNIKIGQYLSDIMTEIPANTIIFKTVTGIGATRLELESERNSIIIEPNVPVIRGKKKKGILGVFEGVHEGHIIDYLQNVNIKDKKIVVTPESFTKVLKAANHLDIDIYTDYFLLFDECDRTMKDVNFRETIILPMDHFFLFKNKAFVSATAVTPTDPRFEESNFEILTIVPNYEYQEDINLIITNNVSMSLSEIIQSSDSECTCIFLNSINGINKLIHKLGIKEESNIYCSKQKATEATVLGTKRVYENIGNTFAKYNFFTSRFYAAVDIFMDIEPDVIMITNLDAAQHTMIDPNSDAIQIKGRFRNGVRNITVISNFDSQLNVKNEEQAKSYIETCEECYNCVKALRNATNKPVAQEALNEALALLPYSSFINANGSKNYYMYDNFFYEEKVKMLFQNHEALIAAYHNAHFRPTVIIRAFIYSDSEEPSGSTGISIKEIALQVINALKKLEKKAEHMYFLDNSDYVLKQLEFLFPDIVEAYYTLGEHELLNNAYSKSRIQDAIKRKKIDSAKSNFDFIKKLQIEFPDGCKGTGEIIRKRFKEIIDDFGLPLKGIIKGEFDQYFNITPRTTISKDGTKGYRILSSKFKS
jgi:hypothetical protein